MKQRQPKQEARQPVPLDLPVDFVMMLDAFCEAHHGATRVRIVKDAVTAMVQKELEESPSLKARYDSALFTLKKRALAVVPPPEVIPVRKA